MQIAVSAKCSKNHSDAVVATAETLRAIINSAAIEDVATDLEYLVSFLVVMSADRGLQAKSQRSYSCKERSEFVNVEIDVNAWSSSNTTRQLELMMEALKDAIRSTKSSRISHEASQTLVSRLQTAFDANVN